MNTHCLVSGILADPKSPDLLTDVLLPLIPWIIILVFIMLFLPKVRRQSGQAARLNQRATEHWDAVERKLDRVIELLASGQDERGNPD